MPRIKCTFAVFVTILLENGFELHRHGATNHRRYRGIVAGKVCMVDMSPHKLSDDIPDGTLQSMIRQSGLPKHLFRK